MVTTGLGETGMLIACLLCRVQADSLTHSQNVIGNHVGHAFSCRHHVRRAHSLLRDTMEGDQLHCLHRNNSFAFVLFAIGPIIKLCTTHEHPHQVFKYLLIKVTVSQHLHRSRFNEKCSSLALSWAGSWLYLDTSKLRFPGLTRQTTGKCVVVNK